MGSAGILLAAGGGSRFAGAVHKLLAEVRGRAVVVRAWENMAAAGLSGVAVVTGAAELAGVLPVGTVLVPNPDWAQGQATSVAAGWRWAELGGFDSVVIGLGDQPWIPAAAWSSVAACAPTPIAVATYGGRRGHPVRLHRDVWDRLPMRGDVGARAVMADSPELVTEVPCLGDPADIDTVEDLIRWR